MSGKTVAAKLAIKPDTLLWLSHADRASLLGPLPDGVARADSLGMAQAVILFADDARSIRALLMAESADLQRPDVFWVAYPKGNRTDINRDSLWPILAEFGMRPNGQVAIDDTWSALRFRALRDGEEPFTGGR